MPAEPIPRDELVKILVQRDEKIDDLTTKVRELRDELRDQREESALKATAPVQAYFDHLHQGGDPSGPQAKALRETVYGLLYAE